MKDKLRQLLQNFGRPKFALPQLSTPKGTWFSIENLYRRSFLYNALAIIVCAYFVADFLSIATAPLIPEITSPKAPPALAAQKNLQSYTTILSRNLFNEKGLIPETDDSSGFDGPPVKTSLPLNLMGVIVVQDELKSVASIEDRGSNQVIAVRVNEPITPETLVQKIESNKVIFINKNSGRREFVDLPKEGVLPTVRAKSTSSAGSGIQKASETNYQIPREEVDKTLSNLNEVLTQARCVPNFENGRPSGYRCFQIVPGSIYDKLGMKDGDVISEINGQSINDPGKAFEIFGQLRTMSSVDLRLKRGTQSLNMHYDFR